MIKNAYTNGAIAAFAQFGLDKDASLFQSPLSQPKPIYNTMVQSPTMNELPNFGKTLQHSPNRFNSILGAR